MPTCAAPRLQELPAIHAHTRRRDDTRRREAACAYQALLIVDAGLSVRYSYWDGEAGGALRETLCAGTGRLRPEIATVVGELIASAASNDAATARTVKIDDDRALRLSHLLGRDDELFAFIVEFDRNRTSVQRAAARFGLTRRQAEVLGLVLEGSSAGDVANALSISEYTAQGYIKALLGKTQTRNRAAMIATVLEWDGARAQ